MLIAVLPWIFAVVRSLSVAITRRIKHFNFVGDVPHKDKHAGRPGEMLTQEEELIADYHGQRIRHVPVAAS